jgi:hypothetical protein
VDAALSELRRPDTHQLNVARRRTAGQTARSEALQGPGNPDFLDTASARLLLCGGGRATECTKEKVCPDPFPSV